MSLSWPPRGWDGEPVFSAPLRKYDPSEPRDDHGRWAAGEPPDWWSAPTSNAFARPDSSEGSVTLDWLSRHKVERQGDGYVFYHATPDKKLTVLRAGSLLETTAAAAKDIVRNSPLSPHKGSLVVHRVVVPPWGIRTGMWASLREDYPLSEVTKRDVSDEPRDDHGRWASAGDYTSAKESEVDDFDRVHVLLPDNVFYTGLQSSVRAMRPVVESHLLEARRAGWNVGNLMVYVSGFKKSDIAGEPSISASGFTNATTSESMAPALGAPPGLTTAVSVDFPVEKGVTEDFIPASPLGGVRANSGTSAADVLFHELTHAAHYAELRAVYPGTNPGGHDAELAAGTDFLKLNKRGGAIERGVSRYATTNTYEFVAEAATLVHRGGTLSPALSKLYRALHGPPLEKLGA